VMSTALCFSLYHEQDFELTSKTIPLIVFISASITTFIIGSIGTAIYLIQLLILYYHQSKQTEVWHAYQIFNQADISSKMLIMRVMLNMKHPDLASYFDFIHDIQEAQNDD
jgi:hypothetical protein